jgi:hypothetical protein
LVCLTCLSLTGTRDALWGNGIRGLLASATADEYAIGRDHVSTRSAALAVKDARDFRRSRAAIRESSFFVIDDIRDRAPR